MASLLDVKAALEREKKEKRNLARRKSYQEKQRKESVYERLLLDAKETCKRLMESAERNAAEIVEKARSEANSLSESNIAACVQLIERRDSLRQQLERDEDLLRCRQRNADSPTEAEVARKKEAARMKEAARKKKAYWVNKSYDSSDDDEASVEEGDEISLSNRSRNSINHAVSWATRALLRKLRHYNVAAKKLFFERFWKQKSLKQFLPKCVGAQASVGAAVIDMRQTLSIIKTAKRRDHLATKQALLTALVGEATVGNRHQSSLAKALGIKRQNLWRASKRRKVIDQDKCVKYPMGERKVRCDKISEEVRLIVEQYWESNTRISPCTKDKARLRLGRKKYEEHRVHWLEDTEVEFNMKFQAWCEKEGNGVAIGLRSFQYLKPYYIRTMKDRMVCCCKQHVEMDLLKEAINKFWRHQHCKDCTCHCPICTSIESPLQHCVASQGLITSVRGWINTALCPIPAGKEWHQKACIMGRCTECGPAKKLIWCPRELEPPHTELIEWNNFKYVELDENAQQRRERKKGTAEATAKRVVRQRLLSEKTSFAEFKQKVLQTMPEFIMHNFRARWQSEQFKLCLKTFPRGVVVSSIDFSENYTFKPQNEIQSMHWDNRQITLLIHVTYRHRLDVEATVEGAIGRTVRMALDEENTRDVIADYHFYISDDNLHDTLFVQHCMDLHFHWMKAQGINLDQHWVWSDGAASQFKACRPFYYVARYFRRFGARMKWFFHASGHGKGVADALGGHIKQGVQREQLKGIQGHSLENALDVVKFCQAKFALGQEKEYGDVQDVRRLFWEIPVGSVNRRKKWDCDPITGSRKLHCFDGFSPKLSTLLQVRDLCCFCPYCVDDDYKHCENKDMVGQFRLEMVKGVLPADVSSDVEMMGVGEGGHGWEQGALGELLEVGDFYAIQADLPNDWDVSFYICQCERPAFAIKNSFVDAYSVAFQKGDCVVKGGWFQPLPGREQKYVFHEKAPFGYNLVDDVVHIRFALAPCEVRHGGKGGARVFTLPSDTLAAIVESLRF